MSGVVDRLLQQLNPDAGKTPPRRASGLPPRPLGAPGAGHVPTGRRGVVRRTAPTLPSPSGVWARVALGLLLAGAMTQWPYGHCGFPLAGYFAAALLVVVAGGWAARASWRRRMATAHVVAIAIVFAGMTVGALQLLPRLGYAPVAPPWICGG